jgi:hypothetical protein
VRRSVVELTAEQNYEMARVDAKRSSVDKLSVEQNSEKG